MYFIHMFVSGDYNGIETITEILPIFFSFTGKNVGTFYVKVPGLEESVYLNIAADVGEFCWQMSINVRMSRYNLVFLILSKALCMPTYVIILAASPPH